MRRVDGLGMVPFGMVMLRPATRRAPYSVLASGPAAFALGPVYGPSPRAERPNAPSHTAAPAASASSAANAENGDFPALAVVWK